MDIFITIINYVVIIILMINSGLFISTIFRSKKNYVNVLIHWVAQIMVVGTISSLMDYSYSNSTLNMIYTVVLFAAFMHAVSIFSIYRDKEKERKSIDPYITDDANLS